MAVFCSVVMKRRLVWKSAFYLHLEGLSICVAFSFRYALFQYISGGSLSSSFAFWLILLTFMPDILSGWLTTTVIFAKPRRLSLLLITRCKLDDFYFGRLSDQILVII
ncbi:hypothetical protein BDW59DRAFT_141262 [Aspergillus cavernicola]|uniref:Uncharacterized protein n=1 Tax=Aspergillus cavernicola TaxID=176166 RepID=A0ABR4IR28_9EURO